MGLHQNVLTKTVKDLDLREVVPVNPTTSCRDAIDLMRRKRVGHLVVLGQDGRPLGLFTERMLIHLLLSDPDALQSQASEHMTTEGFTIRSNESIANVIQKMSEEEERFLCVVDDRGRPIGIAGQKSVMEYLAENFPRQVKVQLIGSKLYMDKREGA
jgi:CBS domain-containing protein